MGVWPRAGEAEIAVLLELFEVDMSHNDAWLDICRHHDDAGDDVVARVAIFITGGRGGKQEWKEQEDSIGHQASTVGAATET